MVRKFSSPNIATIMPRHLWTAALIKLNPTDDSKLNNKPYHSYRKRVFKARKVEESEKIVSDDDSDIKETPKPDEIDT